MRRFILLVVAILALSAVAGPVAAAENSTAAPTSTPTPTPTANQTDTTQSDENQSADTTQSDENQSADTTQSDENQSADQSKRGDKAADVYVEQPRHISKTVDQGSSNGINSYSVHGAIHELDPQGFNASQVVRSGVREDAATLKYDKGIGRWILNSQGTAGTYRVFWVVRDGGQTTTYAAIVNVKQASYKHVSPNQWQKVKDKASNWDWAVGKFVEANLISEDSGVEKIKSVIEDAVTWYQFYDSPLSALTGQFVSLGIMLISWPAGWIILGTLLLIYFWRDRQKTRQNRRFKRQFARIEDVDEAEREAEERELKRILSMKTFTDLGLTESDGEAIKEHCDADNPRQFLDSIRKLLSEQRMVRLLLDAHDQLGHQLRVRRTDSGSIDEVRLEKEPVPTADGGTAAAGGDDGFNVEFLAPSEADDDVILHMDWCELDPEVLWADTLDTSELDLPIKNNARAEDDLVDEFEIPIGEDGHDYYILERREEFAELLVTFIQHVAASEYTDEEGRPRADADIVDFLYTFTSVSAEKYRWPLHNTRDILLRCRQLLDADSRMQEVADRSQRGDL